VAQRKRVAKKAPAKRKVRRPKTVANPFPTKLEQRFIESKAIYDAALAAGWKADFALAFAMERDSWPDWFIDPADPIKKIGWQDGEEDI
jgi:hypothetical protein